MRRLIWVLLILVVVSSVAGCARTGRIVDDVNWVVFDGEPSKEN